jgi:CubicO group peptidase (beta-lactamase class C family)
MVSPGRNMKQGIVSALLLALLAGGCGSEAEVPPPGGGPAQEEVPAPLQGGPPSDVPLELQLRRWHMLDADVSATSFRRMDELFPIDVVARGGPVWELPRDESPLDFTYQWQGQTLQASAFAQRTLTSALLILKDGRIVSETYRNGGSADNRFAGWSISKSITSVLVGCALADGSIASLDAPIVQYIPELVGSAYDGVSILDAMEMRSGVAYDETYDFSGPGAAAMNHVAALIRNTVRFGEVARTLPRRYAPGEQFEYKTIDTAVMGWLLERATQQSIAAYTASCLWQPLGAEANAFYIMDGPPGVGRAFNGAGFNATLRDYGRFGQMMLDEGVADGRRIVSADWVQQSTQPRRAEDTQQGGYGLQWWTVVGSDAYMAVGLQGQYIYIAPEARTVVVKLSHFPPGDNAALEGETMAFINAAVAWNP